MIPGRFAVAVLAAALLALSFGLTELVRNRSLDGRLGSDEPEWIAISILHWRQLVHGGPPAGADLPAEAPPGAEASPSPQSGGRWEQGVQATTFGYMNPGLPKLVWGAAFDAAGFRTASPYAFQMFHKPRPEQRAAAWRPLQEAEPLARRVVITFAALTAVLVFFVAREAWPGGWGWACGALAYALWFASPLVQDTASTIRTDYFMLPFCLAALLFALRARGRLAGLQGPRALLAGAAGLGALAGLAVSSKLNGALVLVCAFVWLPWLWARGRARSGLSFARGPLAALAAAGGLAFLVFFALNPRLWSGPIEGVRDILERWDGLIAYFQDDWAPRTGVEVARTPLERVALFLRRTLERDDPLRALTALPLGAVLLPLGLAALALAAFARPPFRALDEAARERAGLLLVFALVFLSGTALWLPLDWERFYLTAAPCVMLLEAAALTALAQALFGGLRRRSST